MSVCFNKAGQRSRIIKKWQFIIIPLRISLTLSPLRLGSLAMLIVFPLIRQIVKHLRYILTTGCPSKALATASKRISHWTVDTTKDGAVDATEDGAVDTAKATVVKHATCLARTDWSAEARALHTAAVHECVWCKGFSRSVAGTHAHAE